MDAIMSHLARFDEIAMVGGLNSRSVLNNYNLSAEYVFEQLSPYCDPWTQHFAVAVHQELERPRLALVAPAITTFQYGVDFQGMRNGGTGLHNFTARVTEVKGGCATADFAGFVPGHIALIQEGPECELYQRAFLAEDHRAVAIFFYNRQTTTGYLGTRVRITALKEGDRLVQKPVLWLRSPHFSPLRLRLLSLSVYCIRDLNVCFLVCFSSNLVGKVLSEEGTVITLYGNQLATVEYTSNVICESTTGAPDSVVMLGAHLGSNLWFFLVVCVAWLCFLLTFFSSSSFLFNPQTLFPRDLG